jgi:HK97 family phage portal protein
VSIFSRIFGRVRAMAPSDPTGGPVVRADDTIAPVLNPFPNATPVFPTGDYFTFAQTAYRRNELVFRGLNMLMDAIAEAPLRVYDRAGEEINDHPIRQIVRRPNPFMGEHLLWQTTVLHLYLSGSAFWEKVRSRSGQVVELWPLRPDRMRIVADNQKFIGGYIYEIAGKQYQLETGDIIHFKFSDPIYDYFGLSPLQAALRRITIDNESADMMKVWLQNYGVPPLFVTVQQQIDESLAKRLLKMAQQRWGGKNRGTVAFLQAGMDIKAPTTTALKDLALVDLDEVSQKRLLAALGVPPVLLGQEATFANYEQSRQFFHEGTVSPLHSMLDDQLEADLLFAEFDASEQYELHFDTSEVPAMRPARESRAEIILNGVKAGAAKRNEWRAAVGLEPEPDGDVYLRPINIVATPAADANPSGEDPDESDEEAKEAAPRLKLEKKAATRKQTRAKTVLNRGKLAERYEAQMKTWARAQFTRQMRDARRAIAHRFHALTKDQVQQILDEIALLEIEWKTAAASSVTPIMAGIMGDAASEAAQTELGLSIDLSNEQVISFVKSYAFKFADKTVDTSAGDVRDLVEQSESEGWSVKELGDALSKVSESWDKSRAELIAKTETVRASNAGALASYKAAGIVKKVWIADSAACPYCNALDGRVIGIDDAFLKMGDSFQPEGADSALSIRYEDVGYPPAHPNCRCSVGAEV